MNFEDNKKKISVSKINTYLNCPRQFDLKYIRKIPASNETKKDNIAIGLAFHKTIDYFFKIGEWLDTFSATLNEIGVKEEEMQEFYAKKEKQLKNSTKILPSTYEIYRNLWSFFYDKFKDFKKEEILTEMKIEFNFNKKYDFNGIIDYYDFEKNQIVDWKTAKRAWNEKDVIKTQDLIYSYIIYEQTKKIPIFKYFVFVYSEMGEISLQSFEITHTKESINEAKTLLKETIKNIEKKVFFKNTNSFLCSKDYCEWYDLCEGYKEKIRVVKGGEEI